MWVSLIQDIWCVFQERQGFIPGKANEFGQSAFTKVHVGQYNKALKDTKLVKRREAFNHDNKIGVKLVQVETQSKNLKEKESCNNDGNNNQQY